MADNTLITADAAQTMGAIFVDCRFNLSEPDAGFEAYQHSHIPDARYAHLDKDLSSPIKPGITGRHPLPGSADFVATLQQLGITNQQPVIAYDAGNGAFAARLWWLMRHLGHEDVWVLDGGFSAWQNQGLPVSSASPIFESTSFKAAPSLCHLLAAGDIEAAPGKLIDARDEKRYLGLEEPIDPVAGHIPGAACWPFLNNVDGNNLFKSKQTLRQQFTEFGLDEELPSVCYCGSGVTACHNVLALVHSGYPEPYLYAGSWSEWITDPSRPIETSSP